jgi:hypothetical protein
MSVVNELILLRQVYYYYYEQMTIAQIAEVLSAPEGTVKRRMSVARDKIRKELEQLEKDEGIKLYGVPLLLTPMLRMAFERFEMPDGVLESSWEGVMAQSASSAVNISTTTLGGVSIMAVKSKVAFWVAGIVLAGGVTAGAVLFAGSGDEVPVVSPSDIATEVVATYPTTATTVSVSTTPQTTAPVESSPVVSEEDVSTEVVSVSEPAGVTSPVATQAPAPNSTTAPRGTQAPVAQAPSDGLVDRWSTVPGVHYVSIGYNLAGTLQGYRVATQDEMTNGEWLQSGSLVGGGVIWVPREEAYQFWLQVQATAVRHTELIRTLGEDEAVRIVREERMNSPNLGCRGVEVSPSWHPLDVHLFPDIIVATIRCICCGVRS